MQEWHLGQRDNGEEILCLEKRGVWAEMHASVSLVTAWVTVHLVASDNTVIIFQFVGIGSLKWASWS